MFVIDSSGSIRSSRWPLVLGFVKDIIAQLEVAQDRVRIGVITYSDNAQFRFSLNQYESKKDVLTAINGFEYTKGKTNTPAALQVNT